MLTERDASNGALVGVIVGSEYDIGYDMYLGGIYAMAVSGGHLFTADAPDGLPHSGPDSAVTEVDTSTGAVVKVLTGAAYGFFVPTCMAASEGHLFVGSVGGREDDAEVIELDASTETLMRVMTDRSWVVGPIGVVVGPHDVFVLNGPAPQGNDDPASGLVAEVDAVTGNLVRLMPS